MKLLLRCCIRLLDIKKFEEVMEMLYKAHLMNMEENMNDNNGFNVMNVVNNVRKKMPLIIYFSRLRYFEFNGNGVRDSKLKAGDILPFFQILLKDKYLDSKLIDINAQDDKFYDALYYVIGSQSSDETLNSIVQLLIENGINTNKIYDNGCILFYIAHNSEVSNLRLDLFKIILESGGVVVETQEPPTLPTSKSSSVELVQSKTAETAHDTETDEKKDSNEAATKTKAITDTGKDKNDMNVRKIGKIVAFDWNRLINTCTFDHSVFHECCAKGYVDVLKYLMDYQNKYNTSTKIDVYSTAKISKDNGLLAAYKGCKKICPFLLCFYVFLQYFWCILHLYSLTLGCWFNFACSVDVNLLLYRLYSQT